MSKRDFRTTTLTLCIPTDRIEFFNELAQLGYNRSFLMLGMSQVLESLFRVHNQFPGGLPEAIKALKKASARKDFFDQLSAKSDGSQATKSN